MGKEKLLMVGCGGMGQAHLRNILKMKDLTEVVACVEPSEEMRKRTEKLFKENKLSSPLFFNNLEDFFSSNIRTDSALIATPHNLHFPQAKLCLSKRIDVLLEKPMVMNEKEAIELMNIVKESKRLLVVAFPGSLSPAIQKTKKLIKEGTIGELIQINALVHQHWKEAQRGKWRQNPKVSGGGFLFDTGSHMINTVVDVLDDDIDTLFAIQDNRGAPVEICTNITARSKKGVLLNLTAAGDSIGCESEVFVIGTKGVIRTGVWGERLEMKKEGEREFKSVEYPSSLGVWEQFLKIKKREIENPCPGEVGLRFSIIMDMVKESAKMGNPIRR